MAFTVRWFISVAASFILYPVAVALWQGPDLKWNFLYSALVVLVMQFMSPWLWLVPVLIGTAIGVAWQIAWEWKASQRD